MFERAEFLDLFGVDSDLLYTDDNRAIALTEPDGLTIGRIFLKDGHIVLQSGDHLPVDPTDFKVRVSPPRRH
jgi:hypothetical protein